MNDKFDTYISCSNNRFQRTLKTVLFELIKITKEQSVVFYEEIPVNKKISFW
jgi:hypothetical protein